MKHPALLLLAAALLPSCAPSTPQARIEKAPEKFAALPAKDQQLVRQGKIDRGMSPEAVELAWGNPDRRLEGSTHGKPMNRWEYLGSRPVAVAPFFGGYGYRYGYGPYQNYGGSGLALGPDIAYIPYPSASVRFIDRRVDSWERVR
jgi:hypothetical protein